MNSFSGKLLALGIMFVAGWLFANEYKPPYYADLNAQVWLVVGVGSAFLMAVSR